MKEGVSRQLDLVFPLSKRLYDWLSGVHYRRNWPKENSVDRLFLEARRNVRAGKLQVATDRLQRVVALAPTFAEALEMQGEILEILGQSKEAAEKYQSSRDLRGQVWKGAPDRPFAAQASRRARPRIDTYSAIIANVPKGVFPYVARGNAFMVCGKPYAALWDYTRALKLRGSSPHLFALRGEALLALGRFGEALSAFDFAVNALPKSPEAYGGRALANMALGNLEISDNDLHQQYRLLPPFHASARACVALRMADYATALEELERALEKEPKSLYLNLYRLMALKRLGKSSPPIELSHEQAWPMPLLRVHMGQLSDQEVLSHADTKGRQAEALFQFAVMAAPGSVADVRQRFEEVIKSANPTMIEYAAACHELARLGV